MTMADYGLGRLHAPDPRDNLHLLAAAAPMQAVINRRTKYWTLFARPLNQGYTGTCVGHGWRHRLVSSPVMVRSLQPSAFDIYDAATKIDEWSDNDNDTAREFGTSVRAGAKVLKALGMLSEYRWTTDADDAADWIGGVDSSGRFIGGPVVIGVNFYDSMFDLSRDSYMEISPTAKLAGGHCMLLIGWDQAHDRFRGINSWGASWGDRGRFWLDAETAQRLFNEDGEVCVATEIKRAP